MKKYTRQELYKMDAVEVYKMVLRGDIISKFPIGFWKQPEAKQNASKCVKYLIEEILRYDDETIKEKISHKIFADNRLRGMVDICFNGSSYQAIKNTYNDKFKEWEFKSVPMGYWENEDNGVKATRWLIEEKLKLTDEELKEQLSYKVFKDNGLLSMLNICFKGSTYKAINAVYPDKFKEWEFKNVPRNYWEYKENTVRATKWLIEEKLKLSDDELKQTLNFKMFKDQGLGAMISVCFKGSPYEAINNAYPNKFKEWEFKQVPQGYWKDKDNGIKATKWLIEEKLKLNQDEVKENISVKTFEDNGLRGMLQYCFNSSLYEAINATYPNKFKEWEFKNVPLSYWSNKENGIKATKWLIEEKLKLKTEKEISQVQNKIFKEYGLGGMLQYCFNSSSNEAIKYTYGKNIKIKKSS